MRANPDAPGSSPPLLAIPPRNSLCPARPLSSAPRSPLPSLMPSSRSPKSSGESRAPSRWPPLSGARPAAGRACPPGQKRQARRWLIDDEGDEGCLREGRVPASATLMTPCFTLHAVLLFAHQVKCAACKGSGSSVVTMGPFVMQQARLGWSRLWAPRFPPLPTTTRRAALPLTSLFPAACGSRSPADAAHRPAQTVKGRARRHPLCAPPAAARAW